MKFKLCLVVFSFLLPACDRPETATNTEPDRTKAEDSTSGLKPSPSTAVNQPAERPAASGVMDINETRRDAEAEFKSVDKMNLEGDVELDEVASGVRIEVEVENAPKGKKAVHIHQRDDCSDIAGESMGSHFAPAGSKHGYPTDPEHHLGDLGNMTVDDDGDGELEIIVARANLKPGDPMSLLGRAVVIHEGEDDGKGESGNSGKPIECAPIKAD